MFTAEKITALIEEALPDCKVRVLDPAQDGRHFQAWVASSAFEDQLRVKQHRLVYAALGDHMKEDIHALQLTTYKLDKWPY